MTLRQWLEGVSFTFPISVDDMREFHTLVKTIFPDAIVDAHAPTPLKAIVCIDLDGHRVIKEYDAV